MQSPHPQTWRILHIEDDEGDHLIVQAMLADIKERLIRVDWAMNVAEGRRKLDENHYQAVLVDYDLGKGAAAALGIELIREYDARGYPAPLILLTGRGSKDADLDALQAGATLHLTKSEINPVLLERSIRYAIQRKQAEAALRERDRKLSVALDAAHLGAWVYHFDSHAMEMDERARLMYRAADIRESHDRIVDEFLHPDDVPAMWSALSKAADPNGDGRYVAEYRILQADGSVRWLNAWGLVEFESQGSERRPVRLTGASRDITLEKTAEQAVRASEARYRQLADAMPQLVWTALPDGSVDYYNRRYELYRGITPCGANCWDWEAALHPDDLQRTQSAWQAALSSGQEYLCEHRLAMANGEFRWHLNKAVPAHDEQGRLVKWYGAATDIHELKMAQADLAGYAEKLKRSNEDLENFALVASHDLQEPLRKIHMFGAILHRKLEGQLSEEAEEYLGRMENAAERMLAMINGLLDLSRVNTRGRSFEAVDLAAIAQEAVSDLEALARSEGGQVFVEALPTLYGDPQQLRRLFQNLIANGLKFHKPGVAPLVRITGVCVEDAPRPQALITVEDNGIGLGPGDPARIFRPFARLNGRSQYEGSGMGLAICQKIVERHGGTIAAEGVLGEGSRFKITLPAARRT